MPSEAEIAGGLLEALKSYAEGPDNWARWTVYLKIGAPAQEIHDKLERVYAAGLGNVSLYSGGTADYMPGYVRLVFVNHKHGKPIGTPQENSPYASPETPDHAD
jgi:hypothetical protein